ISDPTGNSNKNKQAVLFQSGSSTSTFKNEGTLIGGSNAASVQVGANRNNGVTIETFTNEGIIGNGTSRFGITVWGKSNNKSSITNFSNSGTIHSKNEGVYFNNTEIKTFTNSGTIQVSGRNQAVSFQNGSSTTTFLNKGTLIGGSNAASVNLGTNNQNGITIETFTNSGIIGNGSSKFGVVISGGGNSKSTINNFNNSGTIHSNNGESIYLGNANVSTFNNSGTISSEDIHGVNLKYTTIDNFTNSGIIKTNGTHRHESSVYADSGFRMTYAHVKTFENTGTISGFMGVLVNGSKIDQFTNKQTIMATQDNDSSFGIMIGVIDRGLENGTSTIKTLKNEGIITSKGQGIVISNK
ncbi:TPA: hypothetical protein RZK29_001745, partial [Campylobacter jejuni]|nr:hypothetical protein [Campylobacter jejuni]